MTRHLFHRILTMKWSFINYNVICMVCPLPTQKVGMSDFWRNVAVMTEEPPFALSCTHFDEQCFRRSSTCQKSVTPRSLFPCKPNFLLITDHFLSNSLKFFLYTSPVTIERLLSCMISTWSLSAFKKTTSYSSNRWTIWVIPFFRQNWWVWNEYYFNEKWFI